MKFVSSKELEKQIADFKHVIEEKKLDTESEIDLLNHELECMEDGLIETLQLEAQQNKKKPGPKGPTGKQKKVKFDGKSCMVPYSDNQNVVGVQLFVRTPVSTMKYIDEFVVENGYTRRSFAINYILKFYVDNYLKNQRLTKC